MLMPKRTKYRKPHRVSYEGKTKGHKEISFGEYGLFLYSCRSEYCKLFRASEKFSCTDRDHLRDLYNYNFCSYSVQCNADHKMDEQEETG